MSVFEYVAPGSCAVSAIRNTKLESRGSATYLYFASSVSEDPSHSSSSNIFSGLLTIPVTVPSKSGNRVFTITQFDIRYHTLKSSTISRVFLYHGEDKIFETPLLSLKADDGFHTESFPVSGVGPLIYGISIAIEVTGSQFAVSTAGVQLEYGDIEF